MKRTVRCWVIAFVLVTVLWPIVARADAYFYYLAVELERSGVKQLMMFPRAFQERPGLTREELVQTVFARLRADRPDLYADSGATVKGDHVEIFLGDAALKVQTLALGELFFSMQQCGFEDVRAAQVQQTPLSAEGLGLAAFLPVVPWWRALPPNFYYNALIQLPNATLMNSLQFDKKLRARQDQLFQPMLDLLRTGEADQKMAAVSALAEMKVEGLAGLLIRLLEVKESSPVKRAVLALLETDRSKRFLDALALLAEKDEDPVIKSVAAKILIDSGNKKFQSYVLLEKLKSPVDTEVLDALSQLTASGDTSIARSFLPVLSHHSPQVREAAFAGLVTLKAHDMLAQVLQESACPPDLKIQAAEHLSGLNDQPEARQAGLMYTVEYAGTGAAAAAASRLGELKAERAIPVLVKALGSAAGGVRQAAARALAAIRSSRKDVLEAMAAAAVRPEDREVMESQIIALIAGMNLEAVIGLSDHSDLILRQCVIKALSEFSKGSDRVQPRILAVLQTRLTDANPDIRRAAVYALARTQDEAVVTQLLTLKDDSDDLIREQVTLALQHSKSPQAKDVLLANLKDPSDRVKNQAVIGVRLQGLHDAVETLRWMVDYGNKDIKREVFAAIVTLAQPADHGMLFDIYARALFDMDAQIKLLAIDGLKVIQDPRVVGQIGMLVRDPEETVQLKALDALGRSGDHNAIDPIAMALTMGSSTVKRSALDALKSLAQEACVRPVQEFIKTESDESLRRHAEDVLRALPAGD